MFPRARPKNEYDNRPATQQKTLTYNFIFLAGLMFEVIDGGFQDIELRITDPEGKVIHEGEEKSGKYTFGSNSADQTYTYCFVNDKGSQVPKTIMFTMDVLDASRAAGPANEGEIGHNKLEDMVNTTIYEYFWAVVKAVHSKQLQTLNAFYSVVKRFHFCNNLQLVYSIKRWLFVW